MSHWEIHWNVNGKWKSAWMHLNEEGEFVPSEFKDKTLAELSLDCFFVEQEVMVEYGSLDQSECHSRDEFRVVRIEDD